MKQKYVANAMIKIKQPHQNKQSSRYIAHASVDSRNADKECFKTAIDGEWLILSGRPFHFLITLIENEFVLHLDLATGTRKLSLEKERPTRLAECRVGDIVRFKDGGKWEWSNLMRIVNEKRSRRLKLERKPSFL